MIINGKEVDTTLVYRTAQNIQQKINDIEELPDIAKSELPKKEIKELKDDLSNFYGGSFSAQTLGDAYTSLNNTLLSNTDLNINRAEYYDTYQEMSECNFIHRGLQIIADDGCQKNLEGNVVKVYSDDEDTKSILENLFNKRLNLNKELWSIIYETCKLGDNFYEIIPDSYEHPTQIARIRYLNPKKVNRIERNGQLAFYTYNTETEATDSRDYFTYTSDNPNKKKQELLYRLEPWQIIHFKISDKDFYPYGGSLLKSGIKAYRRLMMLEDGMVIYRLARVPERRVFRIDVGNLSTHEAMRAINKIKDNYRSAQIMDEKGNINKKAAALSLTQDIFVPVREGQSGTQIDTLQAGTGLQNIDDIKYFRDEILWTLNIPSEYLGLSENNQSGRGSLAMQDVKFARFIERIQYYIEEGLTKIAAIELFFKKKKKAELSNFNLELTPPSNVKEIMDIEYLNQRMSLISSMAATNMFPTDYILKYVMRLSKKEISDIKFFKSIEAQNQTPDMMGGMGGMGGAPMMGGDMGAVGGMDMGAAGGGMDMGGQPPAMSVTTENMVKLFGKDVLIENKKDFSKLIKLVEEYENNKKNEIEDSDETNFKILKEVQEILGDKEHETTNDIASSLFYENEFGGLNFGKSFKIYKKEKGKKGTELLEEEIDL